MAVAVAVRRLALSAILAVALLQASAPAETTASSGSLSANRLEAFVLYQVGTRGDVEADVHAFADKVDATLNDARGWALDGRVRFAHVARSEELRIWLASPAHIASVAPGCGRRWSCRVDDDVYINAERWQRGATTFSDRTLDDYRAYVVNHEVGHWLGLGHRPCRGDGRPALVMQQQSKALHGCTSTVWPLPVERDWVESSVSDLEDRG